jgi:non-homologous end joining protein Ku
MWLMMKTILLLHEVLVVLSPKHDVLVVLSLMWKAHVKSKVSSKNEL